MGLEGQPKMTWDEMVTSIEVGPILDRKVMEFLSKHNKEYITAEFSEVLFEGEIIKSSRTGELIRPSAMITDPNEKAKILEAVYEELEKSQTDE
ncbi:MAG: hypothetical protein WAZ44_03685 [Minisyncoccia bacterium]